MIISPTGVQQVLSNCTVFEVQQLVNGKLNSGENLTAKEKLEVSRALCSNYFEGMLKNHESVVLDAKMALAKSVVEAYDCLKAEDDSKPPESDWFFKNNGDDTGPHTGFIQNWVHNTMAKYRVKKNKRKGVPSLTPEISQALNELEELQCIPEELERAKQLLATTFDLRNAMRRQKDNSAALLVDFKQLLAFDGDLIHFDFDLMYPTNKDSPSYGEVAKLCVMLSDEFNDIANDGIRMLMTVKKHLKHRGVALTQNADHLPALEEDVATFVWFQQPEEECLEAYRMLSTEIGPLIACANVAFAEGEYSLFVDGQSIWTGSDFYQALDLWFKSYHVFAFNYPPKSKPTMQFLEIVKYNIKQSSRAAGVNALVARIKKSL